MGNNIELKSYSKVIYWAHLTELTTKINCFYYGGDNALKLRGEVTLETIIKFLGTQEADALLEKLQKNK